MNFIKTKVFKIMNIVSSATLFVIVCLNLIASFVTLSKAVMMLFIILTCVGAIYVIGFNIFSIIAFYKFDKKQKEDKEKNEKK